MDEPCVYEKDSRSTVMFLMLYVNEILLNGNDVSVLQLVNILSKNFLHKRP